METSHEVLVVEDSRTQAEQLRLALEGGGYRVRIAASGSEALRLLAEKPAHVVLSDIVMEEMDGYELCRAIKDDPRFEAIPVILLTSLSETEDVIRGLESGADNFITKPYDLAYLISRLQSVLLNQDQYARDGARLGLELHFAGKRHYITADRLQVLNLLLSTYENAVRVNRRLQQTQGELQRLNASLEAAVLERTKELGAEVAEHRKAAVALRESEERYRYLFETMEQGVVYQAAADGGIVAANPAAQRILGLSLDQLQGRTSADPRWRCLREDGSELPAEEHPAMVALRSGKPVLGALMAVSHPAEKDHRWILIDAVPEYRPGETTPYRVYTIFSDVTDRIRAEAEREKLEAQYRQAQKMEAVGRLAGGVAHDFNNMLQVIGSYAELVLRKLDPSDPNGASIRQIAKACQRSADLTRQLLAFARKQAIAPKSFDPDVAITSTLEMLGRLIGEDIELLWKPGGKAWLAMMDPSQMDQILTNLALNARDAIDGVGRISIETGTVVFDDDYCRSHAGATPGEYVMLSISDDGCGMDRETQARVFEPFFTTKPQGKGTGLGLPTVYGIVKQNGGFINVYSELGEGTTVTIYLPRHAAEAPVCDPTRTAPSTPTGRETVLLVEDEPALLDIGEVLLEDLGYRVLAAGSPRLALQRAGEYRGQIDLVLTDVVMPEMRGQELWLRLREARSGLRCLFMSGYTANALTHRGALDEGINFLQKPFSREELAMKVRQALSAPVRSAGAQKP